MRYQALALVFASSLLGCESKKSTTDQAPVQPRTGSASRPRAPRAQLTDLTTASTLAPVRAAFNAKKGEARFQSRLPKWAEGRVDVVGEQSELAALLTAIVVPFVERYPRK